MNKKLLDAMEHISDCYIADAIAPKTTIHYSWLGAVAAILVIALMGAIIFPGLGSAGDPSSTTAPILQRASTCYMQSRETVHRCPSRICIREVPLLQEP